MSDKDWLPRGRADRVPNRGFRQGRGQSQDTGHDHKCEHDHGHPHNHDHHHEHKPGYKQGHVHEHNQIHVHDPNCKHDHPHDHDHVHVHGDLNNRGRKSADGGSAARSFGSGRSGGTGDVSRTEGLELFRRGESRHALKIRYDRVIDRHRHGAAQYVSAFGQASPIQADAAAAGTFRLTGLHCADCAATLEKVISGMKGVRRAEVNIGSSMMTLQYAETPATTGDIVKKVRQLGYDVLLPDREASASDHPHQPAPETSFWRRSRKAKTTALSALLFLGAWAAAKIAGEDAAIPLYVLSIAIGGYAIVRSGLTALKSWTVGMDLLMTIAVLGAAAIGQWQEGAAVVVLFSLGEVLEAFTMDRTRRSIRQLTELAPAEAFIRRDGIERMLAVREIRVGDVMLVKPGGKIAMDGTVLQGRSLVNQAPITGESVPVEKTAGDEVFAGTINQHGTLEVQVTRLTEDSTLSRIVRLVEEAQARKAPSQRFVDVFAKYYTPAVIMLALLVLAVPVLIFGQPWETWFYRALMLLVVSCPCALVISTPVSVVAAIGNAARNGVLIKGGAHLEKLGTINAVAFDKTGTLTTGVPSVSALISLSERTQHDILKIAASIEIHSEHPVASAIVRKAREEGIAFGRADDFTSAAGHGAHAVLNGTTYYVGSPRWFRDELKLPLNNTLESTIGRLEKEGQTVILLGTAEKLLGLFAAADEIRAESRETIRQLKQIGVADIVMLTGDNAGAARAAAAEAGIADYQAELMPQDKVAAVRWLMQTGASVAMIGDGVNDAPALAEADLGIAMGAAGTAAALETADVALMADDLGKLPYAVELGRRALRIIRENIGFSLFVKAVFIALIFLGRSTLWMAVLADTGSALIVIANGMRLLRNGSNLPLKLPAERKITAGGM